jgi:hypothetical protein
MFEKMRWLRIGLIFLSAATAFHCGGSSTPTTPTTPPAAVTVNSVAVSGTATLTSKGQTSQLTATASLSNGTTQDVTSQATWQSDNAAVASVSSSGLVTANAEGEATITATYQSKSGTLKIKADLPKNAIPELTANLTFTTVNTPFGKYLAQSRLTWTEKGGTVGYNVTSLNLRFLDQTGKEFTHSTWTGDDIKNILGGDNHINAGQSRDWDWPRYLNLDLTTLTVVYESTVVDDLGKTTLLTLTKSAPLTLF